MGGDHADVRLWAGELEAVQERFVHRFNREEPRTSETQMPVLIVDDTGFLK
jgi:hypothetical protein